MTIFAGSSRYTVERDAGRANITHGSSCKQTFCKVDQLVHMTVSLFSYTTGPKMTCE